MEKSAIDLMQEAIVAAVLDAVIAWKGASGGLANVLARDLGAVHQNTTLGDLPKDVQSAITASTRAAFNRLLKEGYTVAKGGAPSRPPPIGSRPPRSDGPRPGPRGPVKPPIVETKRPPRAKGPSGAGPGGGGPGRGGPGSSGPGGAGPGSGGRGGPPRGR